MISNRTSYTAKIQRYRQKLSSRFRRYLGLMMLGIFAIVFAIYRHITVFTKLSSFKIDASNQDIKILSRKASQRIWDSGIRLLALDFDYTIVDIHTGGRWKGSSQSLCEHVRPAFIELLPYIYKLKIAIAIVTFSSQVELISNVTKCAFPSFGSDIFIRGNDNSWPCKKCFSKGKYPHILSVIREIQKRSPDIASNVTLSSTLLIDDYENNIINALRHGAKGIIFNHKDPIDFLTKLDLSS